MKALHKRLLLLVCGLFVFLVALLGITHLQKQELTAPLVPMKQHSLSDEEYTKLQKILEDDVTQHSPKEALTELNKQSMSDAAVARVCHGLAHAVGHAAYKKYQSFGKATEYQNDMCNSGYLHGVIESHFVSSKDIFQTMQTVCEEYDPNIFVGWECYHGVGHGLMFFTNNMLPKSVKLCNTYTDTTKQTACRNGVFMENFTTDQKLHPSRYLQADNPFYPCPSQQETQKADCYLYAPTYYLSLYRNDYTGALQWCKTAEKDFQLSCMQGVGMQTMKDGINKPQVAESVCMQASGQAQQACIVGMLNLYMNHFGRVDEAKALCPKLHKENHTTCKDLIASQEHFFKKN